MLPAYAGMIRHRLPVQTVRFGAPRVCGDDPYFAYPRHQYSVVLPAYAGMILRSQTAHPAVASAPRVCGDDPRYVDMASYRLECSPRMRG